MQAIIPVPLRLPLVMILLLALPAFRAIAPRPAPRPKPPRAILFAAGHLARAVYHYRLAHGLACPPSTTALVTEGYLAGPVMDEWGNALTFSCSCKRVRIHSAELAPVCESVLESWTGIIAVALAPLPPARRRVLARFVITALQGAFVQARAARSTQPVLEAGEIAASLVRAELHSF